MRSIRCMFFGFGFLFQGERGGWLGFQGMLLLFFGFQILFIRVFCVQYFFQVYFFEFLIRQELYVYFVIGVFWCEDLLLGLGELFIFSRSEFRFCFGGGGLYFCWLSYFCGQIIYLGFFLVVNKSRKYLIYFNLRFFKNRSLMGGVLGEQVCKYVCFLVLFIYGGGRQWRGEFVWRNE